MKNKILGFILGSFLGVPSLVWAGVVISGAFLVISGTTPIQGGATTQICYNQAGFLTCGNSGAVFDQSTGSLTATNLISTGFIRVGTAQQMDSQILTSGTMNVSGQAQVRETTHSYMWTNAMVAALSGTAGDIAAFTLPAKEAVKNFYVIITGAAVGPATVTVSCGRTAAGYIDYIVESNAKAAANTIYGNASAERGTNLTGYDLVSYTATTPVLCHFISTGANLSTVTGSTGTVVVTTELVP